ncbi:MAG: CDGSH iron-sulfur domain-containing protein [Bacteroidetes bacterium]|nr:CDGSH iron-sulfur domain-containing protein [Bacteroidota bacterium]MBU1677443.1 CDGSH iron-sulfur domain-containing protein [Bacteroidota bacterium]MBU2506172.1 CDGSH iron-sulfur domain-containing protein [Bacteroidota bacterium]
MADPKVAQKMPYVQEVKPGKYAWCACGESSAQPLCDGSHKGTEFKPLIVEITEEKKAAWCGCKHTSNKPFCDGSHSKL